MTRTETPDRTPQSRAVERYGQFETKDALVVYDRQDTSRWLQSDVVVSLEAVR